MASYHHDVAAALAAAVRDPNAPGGVPRRDAVLAELADVGAPVHVTAPVGAAADPFRAAATITAAPLQQRRDAISACACPDTLAAAASYFRGAMHDHVTLAHLLANPTLDRRERIALYREHMRGDATQVASFLERLLGHDLDAFLDLDDVEDPHRGHAEAFQRAVELASRILRAAPHRFTAAQTARLLATVDAVGDDDSVAVLTDALRHAAERHHTSHDVDQRVRSVAAVAVPLLDYAVAGQPWRTVARTVARVAGVVDTPWRDCLDGPTHAAEAALALLIRDLRVPLAPDLVDVVVDFDLGYLIAHPTREQLTASAESAVSLANATQRAWPLQAVDPLGYSDVFDRLLAERRADPGLLAAAWPTARAEQAFSQLPPQAWRHARAQQRLARWTRDELLDDDTRREAAEQLLAHLHGQPHVFADLRADLRHARPDRVAAALDLIADGGDASAWYRWVVKLTDAGATLPPAYRGELAASDPVPATIHGTANPLDEDTASAIVADPALLSRFTHHSRTRRDASPADPAVAGAAPVLAPRLHVDVQDSAGTSLDAHVAALLVAWWLLQRDDVPDGTWALLPRLAAQWSGSAADLVATAATTVAA